MKTNLEELRPKEVARELGRSRKWLWDAIRKGQFPAPEHRNCRCLVWTRDVVEAYKTTHTLRQRKRPAKPAPPRPVALQLAAAFSRYATQATSTPMPVRGVGASSVCAPSGNNANTCAPIDDDGTGADGPPATDGSAPAISEHAGQGLDPEIGTARGDNASTCSPSELAGNNASTCSPSELAGNNASTCSPSGCEVTDD